ncbi:hypothetical protein F5B22DRAFT_634494 [Xylaria bambusicola]|uniref:uncharacterized protein n=1 Tax=Xylaria bambusicola TaxID=326684 RepID=UPI002008E35A|nr:uncharacterized protein F5B22DRAFT_634494 [Xylaria bambusicola]KAI0521591.1 hypothetical protein F5B22DRAFT_634494 [Xylaria bambusicola]
MINRGGRAGIPFRRLPLRNPSPQPPPELKNSHEPTPKQCAEVKEILAKTANFPPELIDIIMDFAEYWACSAASIDYSATSNKQFSVHGGRYDENQFLLRTEPLGLSTWHSDDKERWLKAAPARKLGEEYPREELERFVEGPPSTLDQPCRKIVFDIVSRDQGWSHDVDTHGTFKSSWTWFDAGIDRFDKSHRDSDEDTEKSEDKASDSARKVPTTGAIRPIWPSLKENQSEYDHQLHPIADHKIQCNRVAEHEWQHHRIEWSWTDDIDPESSAGKELEENGRGAATGDGRFLRSLKLGDMVTVWGRARFPGWNNSVQKVRVAVYWAL